MTGPLTVAPRVRETVDRALATLSSPGTWLTGEQRVAVASRARQSIGAEGVDPADDPVLTAAHRVAAAPVSITAGWIDGLESDGLHRLAYVEVVGVAARICAIDAFLWAVGQPRPRSAIRLTASRAASSWTGPDRRARGCRSLGPPTR